MLPYYKAVRQGAQRIAEAIDYSVEALRNGQIEQEPAMTEKMTTAIERSLTNYRHNGIRWRAKSLTDRGVGSQESKYGADFMGVLNIALPEFQISKGFLAQAKLIREGRTVDLDELKQQCEKMLRLSPDSFVFLYAASGVRVVPAISVVGSKWEPQYLYSRSAERFFEEHLECFIGDRNINAPTPDMLIELQKRFEARSAIWIQAGA